MGFQIDTSGTVRIELGNVGGEREVGLYRWHNLSPFTQGYVEAALASPYGRAERGETFAACGYGFRHLAPETQARMIADCEAWVRERGPGWEGVGPGQHFWRVRAEEFDGFGPIAGIDLKRRFPPLTLSLGDDGKVYAEARP